MLFRSQNFETEDEAVLYAIHCQRDRRNTTDADLFRWIQEADKRKTAEERAQLAGRPKKQDENNLGTNVPKLSSDEKRTSRATAELVGTHFKKVERARAVIDHGTPEIKQAVLSGEMTIHAAREKTQEQRREAELTKQHEAPRPIRETYSSGLQYCAMAISQMERIHSKDIQRELAFKKMQKWLDENV